jgi:hypothetical protein
MKIYDIRINTGCGNVCGWHEMRPTITMPISPNERRQIVQPYCKLFAQELWSYKDGAERCFLCKAICQQIEKEPAAA